MVDVIQTVLLGLAYEPGLEPLMSMVTDVSIHVISARVEGVKFREPTKGLKGVMRGLEGSKVRFWGKTLCHDMANGVPHHGMSK